MGDKKKSHSLDDTATYLVMLMVVVYTIVVLLVININNKSNQIKMQQQIWMIRLRTG